MKLKFSIDDILKDGRKDSASGSMPTDCKFEFLVVYRCLSIKLIFLV